MTLVLRNRPVYRFRYVDTNGMERFAVLYKGQSTAHLNISEQSIGMLKRLVVGIGGEPHPIFTEVAQAVAAPAAQQVQAAVVAAPVAQQAQAEHISEEVGNTASDEATSENLVEAIAEAPVAQKTSKPKPKAKAKKPTVNS